VILIDYILEAEDCGGAENGSNTKEKKRKAIPVTDRGGP
jgi:hypothetical protein